MNTKILRAMAYGFFAGAVVSFMVFCALGDAPEYKTKLVEVYTGSDVSGKYNSSGGPSASGIFKHADGSYSTKKLALDVAYRWSQGERDIEFMLPIPAENEKHRKKEGTAILLMFASMMLGLLFCATAELKRI